MCFVPLPVNYFPGRGGESSVGQENRLKNWFCVLIHCSRYCILQVCVASAGPPSYRTCLSLVGERIRWRRSVIGRSGFSDRDCCSLMAWFYDCVCGLYSPRIVRVFEFILFFVVILCTDNHGRSWGRWWLWWWLAYPHFRVAWSLPALAVSTRTK
jgi:hypothetical protein